MRVRARLPGARALRVLFALAPVAIALGACTAVAGLNDLSFNGPEVPCQNVAQCSDLNPCTNDACLETGLCDHSPAPDTMLDDDVPGDCRRPACSGGNLVHDPSPSDNDDKNPCTTDSCDGTTPKHTPKPDGSACSKGVMMGVCKAGSCEVACHTALDCDDKNPCTTDACFSGSCQYSNMSGALPANEQTAGDCADAVCRDGVKVNVPNDMDVPMLECATALCRYGTPILTPIAIETKCSKGVCDGEGACVACNVASECPGKDTFCAPRACVAHACTTASTPKGTKLPAQSKKGDCHVDACDGQGGVESDVDDTDAPFDPSGCVVTGCSGGAPTMMNAKSGTACGVGLACDGAGSCAGCASGAQCGAQTDCVLPTCGAGTCQYGFTAKGAPASKQTPGDCLSLQCDGLGSVVAVNDDTDVPAAMACTTAACADGAAVFPPTFDAACNGADHCDGTGACVACNASSECPAAPMCMDPSCAQGACGTKPTAKNTPLDMSAQTAGDCKLVVCDGAGSTTVIADELDVPSSADDCMAGSCTGTTPMTVPAQAGTVCKTGPGYVCDGQGKCKKGAGLGCAGNAECASGKCIASFCQ